MAKGCRGRRRIASRQRRSTPYPLPQSSQDCFEGFCPKNCSRLLDKKDWEDVTCSVCLEYPHHAVLLLCSSHDKGCRPYMCATSHRHSNCLNQYRKANVEAAELACPLCRGQVKGWTVVEVARDFLNAKKRSCIYDGCSFAGNYKELRKHVRAAHPATKPREVDPAIEQKWRRMENERERGDVISMITSAMPGAMFFGDYVIEDDLSESESDEDEGADHPNPIHANRSSGVGINSNLVNVFLLLHAFGSAGSSGHNRQWQREVQASLEASAQGNHHTTPVDHSDPSDLDDSDRGDESINNGVRLVSGRSSESRDERAYRRRR